MKYSIETEIDAPIDDVAALVDDPSRWKEWMDGLEHVEHVSGTPGMRGAESKLTFETAGTTMTMHGTVVERNLPDEYRQTMEAPHVDIRITTSLSPLSSERTRHVSTQEYEFHGIKDKVVGQLMRWTFKKQTKRHVENFKKFAETEHGNGDRS